MGVRGVSTQKPIRAYILYMLTFSSGKKYVGQTVQGINLRVRDHRKAAMGGSQLLVHKAWRAHGEPTVSVLCQCESHEELHKAEIEAIAANGTLSPDGYNLSFGGETAPSINPDVARKISASLKGREFSEQARKRMSEAAIRRGVPASTIEKLIHSSRNHPRQPASDEKRANLSIGIKAAWADPVKRERLVAARKKAWATRRKHKEARPAHG